MSTKFSVLIICTAFYAPLAESELCASLLNMYNQIQIDLQAFDKGHSCAVTTAGTYMADWNHIC